jgi:predicted O-methyltransferase YrrM
VKRSILHVLFRRIHSPALLPPVWPGVVLPPPIVADLSRAERSKLFEEITLADLNDQIGAPDICMRVSQILNSLSYESPDQAPVSFRNPFVATRYWDHCYALTWFAQRFRPANYLEMGGGIGQSIALVALNSPRTALVCLERDWNPPNEGARYFPEIARRELSRCGLDAPITFVSGHNQRIKSRPLAESSPGFQSVVPRRTIDFDLIFVDGSRSPHSMDKDLKDAFHHCSRGGLVIFHNPELKSVSFPGQHSPRLHGLWEDFEFRFPGFRFIKGPEGCEVGLAFRIY